MTRLLIERDAQGGAQAIPPTLQQSLAARLDRLGETREVAQIGAVLGRGFPHVLLQAVAGLDEAGLRSALERLAQADILFIEGDGPQANYRFKHALIQDAAYESLLKSRRQALHRRAAEILRDQPERAAAEPEAIAHHFTEAGLDDAAIEWWGKAGDQALRRSAFQEAIAHLGKAIAMAEARAGAGEKEKAGGKLKLQVALGNALMTVRGQGAPEAQAAFERARVTASAVENAPERLVVTYGLWAGAYLRGELGPLREHATAFLRDVAAQPDSPEAGVAHRANGITAWCAGNFVDARRHLEQALAIFNPNRDKDLAFSFGHDPGVAAMAYLSLTLWPLGEIDRARRLVADMMRRTTEITHAGTICFANMHAGYLEMMRGDPIQTDPFANALARLARDHDLKMWTAFGVFLEGWTAWQAGARAAGLAGMRDGVSQLAEQGVVVLDALIKTKLAQAEADDGAIVAALTIIDEAIAVSERTGHRWYDAEIRRTRGEILLKQNPADTGPAEESLLAAIAIAQAQKAPSFELRAALSLAKLYRSTGRDADAHAALGPALGGFAPMPEFPEIAEAKALYESLAQSDAVKASAATHGHRVRLQVSYANALIAARGHDAPETAAAYERARDLGMGGDLGSERLSVTYGLWIGSFVRGDLTAMRRHSEAFLRDCANRLDSGEACVANRIAGATNLMSGDFVAAREHLEKALAVYDAERDRDLAFRYGTDLEISALSWTPLVLWPLGEQRLAQERADRLGALIAGDGHAATTFYALVFLALYAMLRREKGGPEPVAGSLSRHADKYELESWRGLTLSLSSWADWRVGHRMQSLAEMRAGLAEERERGAIAWAPFVESMLADCEAEAGEMEAALASINGAISEAERIGQHWFEAESHRIRGEILLKRNPTDPAAAEESFLAAVAVAHAQKARSFELRAALALAKLYQSAARPADAHAVLAAALEGFSPTPEMLESAEAHAVLATLSEADDVRKAAALRKRQIDLQLSYGNALIATRGHGAVETTAAFARARELASGVDDFTDRLSIYFGLWLGSFVRGGELVAMREAASEALALADRFPASGEAAVAHRMQGLTYWFQGDFEKACAHLDRALAIFDPERDRDLAFRFGQDIGVSFMNYLALALWPMGEIERARELENAAVARARETDHVATLAYATGYRAIFEMMRRDAQATEPYARESSRWEGRMACRCTSATAAFRRAGPGRVSATSPGASRKCARALTPFGLRLYRRDADVLPIFGGT